LNASASTPPNGRVRVAVVGTSWWADSMYLPAIAEHPGVDLVAVVGRNADRAATFADKWGFDRSYTDVAHMLDEVRPAAVIVATGNEAHVEVATAALEAGAHVLCEKPLGRNADEAQSIARAAAAAGTTTLVPFTYADMPTNRHISELIADGWLGTPHHLNLRYYTDFSLDDAYAWRFDEPYCGSGIIGDIGSHFLYLARLWFGEVSSVAATTRCFVDHGPRPDGTPIVPVNDSAVMTLNFESGAYGVVHASAVCWEGTPFGQVHEFDLHGSDGTLHSVIDWDTVQEVRGVKRGATGPAQPLPLPEHLGAGLRFDTVHNTYRDVFRTTPTMTRGWIDAIIAGKAMQPDLATGARIAELVDAAIESNSVGGTAIAV